MFTAACLSSNGKCSGQCDWSHCGTAEREEYVEQYHLCSVRSLIMVVLLVVEATTH